MKRVLVTGIDGFTGPYLARELAQAGYEVLGMQRHPMVRIPDVAAIFKGDLTDIASVKQVVTEAKPDVVAHLAAISFVGHGDVEGIYRANLFGTRNLLEALVQSGAPLDAVLLTSSANVYGNARGGVLDEDTPPQPANDYAVSKLAMEHVAHLYDACLPIIITRPFNYTGVGQAAQFLIPKIVDHFRRRTAVIELGNIDVARNFSDVRQVVACYRHLLQRFPAAAGGTFNVCSGESHTLMEVIGMLETLTGHRMTVTVNPAFVRANEVRTLLGDRRRLEGIIGPVANIPLQDTLRWMLEAPPAA